MKRKPFRDPDFQFSVALQLLVNEKILPAVIAVVRKREDGIILNGRDAELRRFVHGKRKGANTLGFRACRNVPVHEFLRGIFFEHSGGFTGGRVALDVATRRVGR